MAGHTFAEDRQRARQARASRQVTRVEEMRGRLAAAMTAEAELNMAFDWMRSSAQRKSKQATRLGDTPGRAVAERVMRKVAGYLAQAAEDLDLGRDGDRA